MSDAVTDTNNSAQSEGPAVPNVDRQPAPAPAPAPAADPAPAPAPAADPAPAEAPKLGDEPTEGTLEVTSNEDGTFAYEATGYPGLDLALEFIGGLGIGLDHPAMAATKDGNFDLIEAHLATLGDKAKGFERMVALAKEAYGQHQTKTTEKATAIATAVSGVLGDAQSDVMAWASKNADDAERAEINTMLAAGPVQARAAANLLLQAYQSAGGTVVKPASALTNTTGNSGDPKQSQTGPLTNKQFANESAKLHRQYGNAYMQRPEYRALAARLG